MKHFVLRRAAAALALVVIGGAAHASPQSDALAKCLVDSTTGRDRIVFVQWFYAAMSAHPDVKDFATSTAEQRATVSKKTAALFERLLTSDCRKETVAAVKVDGAQALGVSFQVFGQAAARELMGHPSVQKELSGLESYFDESKLKAVFDEAKP